MFGLEIRKLRFLVHNDFSMGQQCQICDFMISSFLSFVSFALVGITYQPNNNEVKKGSEFVK